MNIILTIYVVVTENRTRNKAVRRKSNRRIEYIIAIPTLTSPIDINVPLNREAHWFLKLRDPIVISLITNLKGTEIHKCRTNFDIVLKFLPPGE